MKRHKDLGFIIQARTASTRLSGKVLKPFFNEKSILEILLEKLLVYKQKYPIVIATSKNKNDDILVTFANKFGVGIFRGDEHDVLKRYINTAKEFNIETIVRVCSDNPFIEPLYIESLIDIFYETETIEYCSFKNINGKPVIKTHLGLFVEIVTLNGLEKAHKETNNKEYLEHVTNYLYSHPEKFSIHLVEVPNIVFNRNDLRFTIDDQQDFDNLSQVYKYYVKCGFDILQTIEFIDTNPIIKNKMMNNITKYNK